MSMIPLTQPSLRHQDGVGLIEVLIALVVISIGCLASAQMQLQGMQDAQHTYHQSQANLLVNEMMERMRNNPEGVSAGEYDDMVTKKFAKPACTTDCSSAQIAQLDLYSWSGNFQAMETGQDFVPALPADADGLAAYGSIAAQANGAYLLTVTWSDMVDGETSVQTVTGRFTP